MRDDDWSLDEGLDDDGPSADDLDRFGDEFATCPACGAAIYDQAALCHVCGHAVHDEPKPKAWIVWTTLLLIVVIVLVWVVW